MTEQLFSFGTLQNPKTQLDLFGRTFNASVDILRGYKTVTIEIKDEAFLSKGEEKYQQTLIQTNNNNDCIKGIVLELTNEELLLADKYEPENYKRIKVEKKKGKETWVYIADDTSL